MGGGLPCAAFGGRADVMERLAPSGPVYQAGTLSGNPVATAAGLATLDLIGAAGPYSGMESVATALADGLHEIFDSLGIGHVINREGSLFSVFFSGETAALPAVTDYERSKAADHGAYARFFHAMLEAGVYLPPSGYEAWFLGATHTDDIAGRTLEAAAKAAATLRS
jgi:glutamate-1-semialdehyde 2,1-aminomutase